MIFAISARAELIGDFEYDLNEQNHTAVVIGKWQYVEAMDEWCNYVGLLNAEIPNEVEYDNQTYMVTKIDDNAFNACASLISVTIPNTVKKIGNSAFGECSSLTTVILPNSIETIGEAAFVNCINLISINLPNSLTSLPDGIFVGCSSLTSIALPNSIITIGRGAFSECSSLSYLEIPNSVLSIGEMAFENCSALSTIILPTSISKISNYMFNRCHSLDNLLLPNSIKSIGLRAFSESGIESIYIPKNVVEIESSAFYLCQNLTAINVDNANTSFYSIDGVLFSAFQLIKYPNGKRDIEYTIPSNVSTISNDAFRDCVYLTSINMPKVEDIGERAFQECRQLSSVVFPSSIRNIRKQSFWGISTLQFIRCEAIDVPNLGTDAFSDKSVPLYVPEESMKLYQGATGWCDFFNIYPISTEGLDDAQPKSQIGYKYLEKNTIYIVKKGIKYSVLGHAIK